MKFASLVFGVVLLSLLAYPLADASEPLFLSKLNSSVSQPKLRQLLRDDPFDEKNFPKYITRETRTIMLEAKLLKAHCPADTQWLTSPDAGLMPLTEVVKYFESHWCLPKCDYRYVLEARLGTKHCVEYRYWVAKLKYQGAHPFLNENFHFKHFNMAFPFKAAVTNPPPLTATYVSTKDLYDYIEKHGGLPNCDYRTELKLRYGEANVTRMLLQKGSQLFPCEVESIPN